MALLFKLILMSNVLVAALALRRFHKGDEMKVSVHYDDSKLKLVKRDFGIGPPAVYAAQRALGDDVYRQGGVPSQFFPGTGNDVSSYNDARLELAPASELFAVPGQLVNIVFLLINMGEPRYFYISVNERAGGGLYNDQIAFPAQQQQTQQQFLNGLSEQRPYLRRNETRNIVISLRIPQNTFIGANKTITLEAQSEGFGGTANSLIRRFFFSVDAQRPDFYDRYGPYCEVLEDTRNTQCADVINNPGNCRLRRWNGKFYFIDYDSGLRSLVGRERFDFQIFDIFFSHTNFIIGTKLPAYYSFTLSCCVNSYSVAGIDLAGNEEVCVAGEGATVRFGPVKIAITVVVLLIVIGAVVGGIAYVVIKKRRNSELAQLKYMQQPR